MKIKLFLPALLFIVLPLFAQESPKEGQQKPSRVYKVWLWQENGDCLWNIAKKIYGDGNKWKVIYEANKDVIKDPQKIFPKQVLKIPKNENTGD